MDKKDLEYLAYQADPSLTVRNLSSHPRISFRKADHFHDDSKSKSPETELWLTPAARGMKEEVLLRPDQSPTSLNRIAEESQLKNLSKHPK